MLSDLEHRQQTEISFQSQVQRDYVAPPKKGLFHGFAFTLFTLGLVFFGVSGYFYLTEPAPSNQVPQAPESSDYEPRPKDLYAANQTKNVAEKTQVLAVNDSNNAKLSKSKTDLISRENLSSISVTNIDKPLEKASSHETSDSSESVTPGDNKTPNKEEIIHSKQAVVAKYVSEPKDTANQHNRRERQQEQTKIFTVSASNKEKTTIAQLKAQAKLAANNNDNEKLINILTQLLNLSPSENKARKQLAAIHFASTRNKLAENLLKDGLTLQPHDSSMRLMLARIYFKENNHQSAFLILNAHPVDQPAADDLLSFRAALAEKMGNYQLAESDYLTLVQRNPLEAKWWLGLGVSHDKQSMGEQAIAAYQQAYSLNQLSEKINDFMQKRIVLLEGRS